MFLENAKTAWKGNQGLSIIELMVALAISSLLVLGVSTLYLDSRSSDRLVNSLSRVQETGRLALNFLAQDIRMAGYLGCMDEGLAINIIANNPPSTNGSLINALVGFEVDDTSWANGTDFDNTAIETSALIGSDVISIQRASSADTQVSGNMLVDNANIQVSDNEMGFVQEDLVLISDCEKADMFRITNTPSGSIITLAHANGSNSSNRLSALYDTTAQIMRLEATTYFVASTGRTNRQGEAINALYRQRDNLVNNATKTFTIEELVEGVDSMQIEYGERLANGNIRFVPADTAGLVMTNVESIRIGLLVSSSDNVLDADNNQTYALPGQDIVADATPANATEHAIDRRLRKEFFFTISIRNRQS